MKPKKSIFDYVFNSLNIEEIVKKRDSITDKLEFLGDGILNSFIISSIYKKFSEEKELGPISRIKSILISKNNFFNILNILKLDTLFKTTSKSIKKQSDVLEIIFGAIFLDSGYNYEISEKCFKNHIEPYVFDILKTEDHLDFKSILQVYSQKTYKLLPKYEIIEHNIISHEKHAFKISLTLHNLQIINTGSSLSIAEQKAARLAVNFLEIDTIIMY